MKNLLWKLVAKAVSHPSVVKWLIARAKKTPYSHIYKDGDVYMERYWLFNPYPVNEVERERWRSKWPSVRLHKIMRPDRDRHMHDHPWDARTIILQGWYREERLERRYHFLGYQSKIVRAYRYAGETATLKFGEYHKITDVPDEGVWTMFITWKYMGTWGFMVDGQKVQWRKYLGLDK